MSLLPDPLFQEAFLTGLIMTPLAALLGCWLRLRDEWLAALGYAHMAGAGGVVGSMFHWSLLPGALAAAVLAGGVKGLLSRPGNGAFGVMVLLGWCVAWLAAANHAEADLAGRVFLDGQLLFVRREQLWVGLGLALLVALLMPRISRELLRNRFQPRHHQANGRPLWVATLVFDLLVVLVTAACTMAMGVMAAFAMVMIPAWAAWPLARGWRMTLSMAAVSSLLAYLAAFHLSLALDQPFGPVMVAMLLAGLLPLRGLARLKTSRSSVTLGGSMGDL